MAKVVSFINYKGGVGKTTVAVEEEEAARFGVEWVYQRLLVLRWPATRTSLRAAWPRGWKSTVTNTSRFGVIRRSPPPTTTGSARSASRC